MLKQLALVSIIILYLKGINLKQISYKDAAFLALLLLLFYQSFAEDKVEHMKGTGGITDNIDKKAYTNLHKIVSELYKGDTLTIPGNVIIDGILQVGSTGGLRDGGSGTPLRTKDDPNKEKHKGRIHAYSVRTAVISPGLAPDKDGERRMLTIAGVKEGIGYAKLELDKVTIATSSTKPVLFERGIATGIGNGIDPKTLAPHPDHENWGINESGNLFDCHTTIKSLQTHGTFYSNGTIIMQGNNGIRASPDKHKGNTNKWFKS